MLALAVGPHTSHLVKLLLPNIWTSFCAVLMTDNWYHFLTAAVTFTFTSGEDEPVLLISCRWVYCIPSRKLQKTLFPSFGYVKGMTVFFGWTVLANSRFRASDWEGNTLNIYVNYETEIYFWNKTNYLCVYFVYRNFSSEQLNENIQIGQPQITLCLYLNTLQKHQKIQTFAIF